MCQRTGALILWCAHVRGPQAQIYESHISHAPPSCQVADGVMPRFMWPIMSTLGRWFEISSAAGSATACRMSLVRHEHCVLGLCTLLHKRMHGCKPRFYCAFRWLVRSACVLRPCNAIGEVGAAAPSGARVPCMPSDINRASPAGFGGSKSEQPVAASYISLPCIIHCAFGHGIWCAGR